MRQRAYYLGFTLTELLVSMAIIFLLAATLLANFPDSSVRLNLINVAHAGELLIREAQIKGSAVESLNATVAGYGVHYDRSTPDHIIYYGDLVTTATQNGIQIGNKKYDSSPIDEAKSTTILPKNFTISKICTGTSYPFTCNGSINTLTVSFERPNPEPIIIINGDTGSTYSGACIEFSWMLKPLGTNGYSRSVRVLGAGLIAASNQPCS